MTDKPTCPDCGRSMVWLSSPQAWKCFKCEKTPEVVPIPWWFWIAVTAMVAILIIVLVFLMDVEWVGTGGNLTQAGEEPATVGHDQVKMIIYFGIIALVGCLVAYLMERGKERCPKCGEVLKRTPTGHYYCMHCRSMFDPEDIEVEVVE